MKNGNEPTIGNVTEEKESELEEFIDYAKIVMGTLGHKVFEPLVQEQMPSPKTETMEPKKEQDFYIKRSGASAHARLTNEGMVVLAGSVIRADMVPSCPDYVKKARELNRADIDESHTLLKEQLATVLQTLTPREEKVLRLRFGLEDGRPRTLEEVGKEFKVTRERIRQIEAKALRKLRHPSRSKKLRDFLD